MIKIDEYKPVDEKEMTELIRKILCKQFGFCPAEPKTDELPNRCIPILKVGDNYIQWSPERNAYRVWASDGTYIGIVKEKGVKCDELEVFSDGKYWGLKYNKL